MTKKHNPNCQEERRTRLTGKNKDKYPAIYDYKQSHTSEKTVKSFGISVSTVFFMFNQ